MDQVCGLLAAKLQREANVVQERRHEDVPFRRHGGLVLRPFGLNRVLRPEHYDAPGRVELPLDGLIEGWPATMRRSHQTDQPRDSSALASRGPGRIFPGVADEDVRTGAHPPDAPSLLSAPSSAPAGVHFKTIRSVTAPAAIGRTENAVATHLRGHERISFEDDLKDCEPRPLAATSNGCGEERGCSDTSPASRCRTPDGPGHGKRQKI